MYFDYLADDLENPKIDCVKCDVEDKLLSSRLIFVKAYIFSQKDLILKDKRGIDILSIKLPHMFLGLNYGKIIESKPDFKLQLLISKFHYGNG